MRVVSRRRRRLLQGGLALAGLGLTAACSALVPRASQPSRPVRIGLLSTSALDPSPESTAFREGLRQHGWIERQGVTVDARFAYAIEGLRARASELIAAGADVIVTIGNEATRGARDVSQTVPIVMMLTTDPVRDGFVDSIGRPGRNVTGLTNSGARLIAKRLEHFKAAVPTLSKVATIAFPDAGDVSPDVQELTAAAQGLGVGISLHPLQTHSFIESAFDSIVQASEDGVLLLSELIQ